jgi:hypothetical protein
MVSFNSPDSVLSVRLLLVKRDSLPFEESKLRSTQYDDMLPGCAVAVGSHGRGDLNGPGEEHMTEAGRSTFTRLSFISSGKASSV